MNPPSRVVTSAIRSASLFLALADLLSRPEFAGWDQSKSGDALVEQYLIQLFPAADATPEKIKASALAIARLIPGTWTREDSEFWGCWKCEATGPYQRVQFLLHKVEAKKAEVTKPANLIDLDAEVALSTTA